MTARVRFQLEDTAGTSVPRWKMLEGMARKSTQQQLPGLQEDWGEVRSARQPGARPDVRVLIPLGLGVVFPGEDMAPQVSHRLGT